MLKNVKIDEKIIIYPAHGIPRIATVRTVFKNGVIIAEVDPSPGLAMNLWKLNPSGYEYGTGGVNSRFMGKRTYGRKLNAGETVDGLQANADRTREAIATQEKKEEDRRKKERRKALEANRDELEEVEEILTNAGIVYWFTVQTREAGRIPVFVYCKELKRGTFRFRSHVLAVSAHEYPFTFSISGDSVEEVFREIVIRLFNA